MPKIRSEKLVTASVSLPQETWDDLKEIGLMMGLREAEMYRRAITLGIIAMKTELKAILDYDNAVVDHDNSAKAICKACSTSSNKRWRSTAKAPNGQT